MLGGGGVTGVGWELGVLRGLEAGGVPIEAVDLVVGTSAGAVVGAQLGSGVGLGLLFQAQLEPPEPAEQRPVELDWDAMGALWLELGQQATGPEDFRARMGARALAAAAVPESEGIERIVSRLPMAGWPARALLVTAVDVATGELATLGPGARVEVIVPDEAAVAAIGSNVLDPAMRAGSARAGLAQGEAAADRVLALWGTGPDTPST